MLAGVSEPKACLAASLSREWYRPLMPSKCRKVRASFWKVKRRQLLVRTVQGVGDRVRQRLFGKIALQIEDIVPLGLNLSVLRFGKAPYQDMHLAFIVGKICSHLLAENHPGQVRDFQASGHRVVIRNRLQIASRFPGGAYTIAADPNSWREIPDGEAPSPQRGCCDGNEYEDRLSTSRSSSLERRRASQSS